MQISTLAILAVLACAPGFGEPAATGPAPLTGPRQLADKSGPTAKPPAELKAPEIKNLGGSRTTLGDIPCVSFSCEVSNPNKAPLMFVGYRSDSFDPPLAEGQISPIYIVELERDDKWQKHPQGWCGTGIDGIELAAEASGKFGFAIPLAPDWTAVRVGIRWSRPLDFSTAESDAFQIAWSDRITLDSIAK